MAAYGAAMGILLFVGWSAVGSPGGTIPAAPVVPEEATTTTVLITTTTTTAPAVTTTIPDVPTTATLPRRGKLVIHGTGDVAIDPWYIPILRTRGWDHAWSGLGGLFIEDDLTVINLECAPSDLGEPLVKKFVF